jgi:hypothetical protein
METQRNRQNTFTVTGVFANSNDAENAYHLLMELGYAPGEVTVMMSDETGKKICDSRKRLTRMLLASNFKPVYQNFGNDICHAIDEMGKFISLPGVSLIVAGDFKNNGLRALTNSVMSDKYAQFYQSLIRDGEIVIDFTPHSAREKNVITGEWENYHGFPIIRRSENAA